MQDRRWRTLGAIVGCWSGLLMVSGVLRAESAGFLKQGAVCRYCDAESLGTVSSAYLAADGEGNGRRYAPDRLIDVLHLKLDVVPDFKRRTVAGQAIIRFRPIAKPLREVRFQAVDLGVGSVEANRPVEGWQNTDEEIIVTFTDDVPAGQEVEVSVEYSAEPRRGLYFRTSEMGYPAGDTHLFTQGETHESRHWYPSYDYPNEKFTTEMICQVPAGMVALSNGRLVDRSENGDEGSVTFHWLQDKPHVNYLICLVAGTFSKLEDRYQDIPLGFYVPPSEADQAASAFETTRAMMGFFEEEIGVAYPWHRYDQVCVHDFHFGGMENTTLTVLTARTLNHASSENLDILNTDDLIAHELVHQWFGDLVTTKDWTHIWLNEGFATYYAHLWAGRYRGRNALLYGLWRDAQRITSNKNDTTPMVWREFDNPMQQFSFRAYPKGSWVLHMLRSQLGEDLYRKCVTEYVTRHQFDNVVTEDLNAVLEELSGRTFDPFFDQWVYHAGHPVFDVAYSWDEAANLVKLTVRQTQKVDDDRLLYQLDLPVRFELAEATVDRSMAINEAEETFYFPLGAKPELARIDPEYTILGEIQFNPPREMLERQLSAADDMIGRLLAVRILSDRKDQQAVEQLKRVLTEDPFYGVRLEASKALRQIGTDEAFEALRHGRHQPDARVRRQVVSELGKFYRVEAMDELMAVLEGEENPGIAAAALGGLPPYEDREIELVVARLFATPSYMDRLATAALRAMRELEDPAWVAVVMEAISDPDRDWTSRGLAEALRTVGYLGRHWTGRDPSRDDQTAARRLLAGYVNDVRSQVQTAAVSALGELGDPRALPILDTFVERGRYDRLEREAREAQSKLRQQVPTAARVAELRDEVQKLQRANSRLEERIDDLSKRLEAKIQN